MNRNGGSEEKMKKKKTGIIVAIAIMLILTAVAGCAGNDKTDSLSDGEYRAGVELLGGSGRQRSSLRHGLR